MFKTNDKFSYRFLSYVARIFPSFLFDCNKFTIWLWKRLRSCWVNGKIRLRLRKVIMWKGNCGKLRFAISFLLQYFSFNALMRLRRGHRHFRYVPSRFHYSRREETRCDVRNRMLMRKGNKCRYSMCTCTPTPFCRSSIVSWILEGGEDNVLASCTLLYAHPGLLARSLNCWDSGHLPSDMFTFASISDISAVLRSRSCSFFPSLSLFYVLF